MKMARVNRQQQERCLFYYFRTGVILLLSRVPTLLTLNDIPLVVLFLFNFFKPSASKISPYCSYKAYF